MFRKKTTKLFDFSRELGDLETLPNEILLLIISYLDLVHQYSFGLTCTFLNNLIKNNSDYLTAAPIASLKEELPLGITFDGYNVKLYFSTNNEAIKITALFFKSLGSNSKKLLGFLTHDVRRYQKMITKEVDGLTGREWVLTFPLHTIYNNLTNKNIAAVLHLLNQGNNKTKGVSLQIQHQFVQSPICQSKLQALMDEEYFQFNLYYPNEVLASLALGFIKKLLPECATNSHVYTQIDPNNRKEYYTLITISILTNIEDTISKLKIALKHFLLEDHYKQLEQLFTEISSHVLSESTKFHCQIM